MTPEEKFVMDLLGESLGLELEIVEIVTDQKTPDFSTMHAGKKYLLELKSSFESEDAVYAKKVAYKQDGIYCKQEVIQPTVKNSNNFSNAHKQLENRKGSESADFCLYILNLTNTDGSFQEQTVFANLLGEANILTDKGIYPCLYYHESDFYKRKSLIDGAIIINRGSTPILVINDYSYNYELFRASSFAKLFTAVFDPPEIERTSETISIRGNVNRKDRAALRLYLEQKYNFEFAIEDKFINSYASAQLNAD